MGNGGRKRAAEERVTVVSCPLPQDPVWPNQLIFLSGDLGDSQTPWIKAVIGIASVVRLY